VCKKKLLIEIDCRCGQTFCLKHRHPDSHNCTYDYKIEWKKKLEKENPVIITPKIEKIY
jgi:AN1-type zinc finger protein 4